MTARWCWPGSPTTPPPRGARDVLAASAGRLGHTEPLPVAPDWMARLLQFDPRRVVFAHDAAVWEPR